MSKNMNTTRTCIAILTLGICLSSCSHGTRSVGQTTRSEIDQATYRYFADAGEANCVVVECIPEFVLGKLLLSDSKYILKDGSKTFTFPAVLPWRSGGALSKPRWLEIVKKNRKYRFLIARAGTDQPMVHRVYERERLVFCSAGFADPK